MSTTTIIIMSEDAVVLEEEENSSNKEAIMKEGMGAEMMEEGIREEEGTKKVRERGMV